MTEILNLVKRLSDNEVIEVLNTLHSDVFKAIPYQQVMDNTRSAAEEIQLLANIAPEEKQQQIELVHSITAARSLLEAMASDTEMARFVGTAWEKTQNSDHMSVLAAIISVGLLVNLALLVVTTEVNYKDGKWEVQKKTANAKQIEAVVAPVTELAKGASGS